MSTSTPSAAPRSPAPPPLDQRFELEYELGRGASSIVYAARSLVDGSRVALKILAPTAQTAAFAQEVKLLGQLSHPHIIRVLDSGLLSDGRPWLAMELLRGRTLEARLHDGLMDVGTCLELIAALAEGVQAAHAAAVLHRDIKPSNIFLREAADGSEVPVLIDFGAAEQLGSTHLSQSIIIGTPAYMAPEQIHGDSHADERSDVYGLGATLYELLTGAPPHAGSSYLATLARLATTRPRRITQVRPELPRDLDRFVSQMLSRSPAERPGSAAEVSQTLRQLRRRLGQETLTEAGPASGHHSYSSRVVTTLVALGFTDAAERDQAVSQLNERGAVAVPLARDAVVAHFGLEQSQGSEAPSAIRLGRRLARRAAQIGIATGRAQVSTKGGHHPPEAIGQVVDAAMALAESANPRQVLVDATTQDSGRAHYCFERRDEEVYEVVPGAASLTPGAIDGGPPFVGREAELARIRSAFARAQDAQHSLLVSLTGPPGIGKSRTQREAVRRLHAQMPVAVEVHQHNEAYGQRRALGCALDIVRGVVRLPRGAAEVECRAALTGLEWAHPLDEEQVDTFCALIRGTVRTPDDGAGEGFRDRLWLLLNRLVEAALARGPVLFAIDDLQWADPESIGWLDHVLNRFENRPLWVIMTTRPTLWAQQTRRFATPSHVRIELEPLSNQAVQKIVAAVGGSGVEPMVLARIVRQAAGSPLHAEELSRLIAAGKNIELVPTIEAAIQTSLDSLSVEQREVLSNMSVFGKAAWDAGLETLTHDVQDSLEALERAGFIGRASRSRFSDMEEWRFRQGMVREVAYSALPTSLRKELHERVALWLVAAGEDASIIAGHWDRAGRPEEAAGYWAQAARRALATSSLADALTLAERSLAFASDGKVAFERARLWDEAWSRHDARASDRESAICAMEQNAFDDRSRTYARGARARYDAARGDGLDINARLAEASEEARRLGLHDELVLCTAELARRQVFAGRFAEGEAAARELLLLSRAPNMRAAALDAWQIFAIVRQSQGALSSALDARRNAVKAAQDAGLREQESVLSANLGFALSTIGARAESRLLLQTGLSLAEEIGSEGAKRHALMLLLCWAATYGAERELNAVLAETREEADSTAENHWLAPARESLGAIFYRGVELLRTTERPQRARARQLLKVAATGYRESGNRDVLPVALGMWGRAELLSGNAAGALALAEEAVSLLAADGVSLLNEAPIFLVLRDACLELQDEVGARHAIQAGMAPLLKRTLGLAQTEYARAFLTELEDNAQLVAAGERHGVLPVRLRLLLEG